ncbi:hypothetical protein GCM10010458_10910 [Microbacterium luteolum]
MVTRAFAADDVADADGEGTAEPGEPLGCGAVGVHPVATTAKTANVERSRRRGARVLMPRC